MLFRRYVYLLGRMWHRKALKALLIINQDGRMRPTNCAQEHHRNDMCAWLTCWYLMRERIGRGDNSVGHYSRHAKYLWWKWVSLVELQLKFNYFCSDRTPVEDVLCWTMYNIQKIPWLLLVIYIYIFISNNTVWFFKKLNGFENQRVSQDIALKG